MYRHIRNTETLRSFIIILIFFGSKLTNLIFVNIFSALTFIKKRFNNTQKRFGFSIENEDLKYDKFGNIGGDGNDAYLASGSYDGTLSVWNLNTRACVKSIKAHFPHRLAGLAASKDGLTLVSVGWDGKILVS